VAAGDCAAVLDSKTGRFHPPTAQHGLREGLIAAKNIEAAIRGRPLSLSSLQRWDNWRPSGGGRASR